ncbi:unnamed protein product [Moneuplotes crassus]|uniref:DNA replication complex GINS protein PSF2 n=1 Tax=Euplotes crassus TaxID=5936 RepID=A0AAD1XZD4_EUPCR|nr:unnamed protein product [Moneuplotes crassus]
MEGIKGLSMSEGEFICQNVLIGVVPKFSYEKVILIQGIFGPFKPQKPLDIPLWLALELKRKKMCDIQSPSWMEEEILKNMIELEKQTAETSNKLENKLPGYYFFEIAILLLHHAADDIENPVVLRTLIEDIFEIRKTKLLKEMKASSLSKERVK